MLGRRARAAPRHLRALCAALERHLCAAWVACSLPRRPSSSAATTRAPGPWPACRCGALGRRAREEAWRLQACAPRHTLRCWRALLQIRRTDAVCAPHARPSECTPTAPGLLKWTNVSLQDVRLGRAAHPLSWHGMGPGNDLMEHHNTKAIVVGEEEPRACSAHRAGAPKARRLVQRPTTCRAPRPTCPQEPNLVRDMHVHFFLGAPNTSREQAGVGCMRLLHLVDLYKVRHAKSIPPVVDSATSGRTAWWWPVTRIHAGGPGPRLQLLEQRARTDSLLRGALLGGAHPTLQHPAAHPMHEAEALAEQAQAQQQQQLEAAERRKRKGGFFQSLWLWSA